MNYYKYYKNLRLDELDIASDEEAEELEFELELRFEEFTPRDRNTWLQQNTYLEHFSRIGSVTSAAREAGVTVYKAQTWKFDNVLGFTRRLEVADLAFNDRLKEKALRRASDPKAPATLLIELLRAYIPEQFSRNGHKCDTSKSDELLRHFREDARREMEAGHPTLRKIAEGATNAHPHDDLPTQSVRPNDNQPLDAAEVRSAHNPAPYLAHPSFPRRRESTNGPHKPNWAKPDPKRPDVARPTRRLQSDTRPDTAQSHLSPAGRDSHNVNLSPIRGETPNTNLSPAGGETQRGGALPRPAPRATQTTKKSRKEKHLPRSPLLTRTTHHPYAMIPTPKRRIVLRNATKCYTYSNPHSLSAPCGLRSESHPLRNDPYFLLSHPGATQHDPNTQHPNTQHPAPARYA